MATGGDNDSHATCSVCLEPFAGRTPKLLPCFHTFCVTCLSQLVERETRITAKQASGEVKSEESPATLTCPTCRTVISVPARGVAKFQTNFYLDDVDRKKKDSKPCNLCDGVKDAQYHCQTCQIDFCATCRRYHDKLCPARKTQGPQGNNAQGEDSNQAENYPLEADGVSSAKKHPQGPQGNNAQRSQGQGSNQAENYPLEADGVSTAQKHLEMVQETLKKLEEQEKRLRQERRALEENIHSRHASLLRHLQEARDACLASLGEVSEVIAGRLQASLSEGRSVQDSLQRQLSSPQTSSSGPAQHHTLAWVDEVKRSELSGDSACLLQLLAKDDPAEVVGSLQAFMGKVLASPRTSQETLAPKQLASPRHEDTATAAMLEVRNQMSEMTRELRRLKAENEEVRNRFSPLLSSQQQEITSLKDKFAILQQEHNVLTSNNDRLGREQADMQKNRDNANVAIVQRDVTTAQSQIASLQHSVSELRREQAELKSRDSTFVSSMQRDVTITQNQIASLQHSVSELRREQAELQKTKDGANITFVQRDVTTAQSQIASLQYSVSELRGLVTDIKNTASKLETKMGKLTTPVAFHAQLDRDLTTRSKRILYFKEIIINLGDGYNGHTGVFTAPVSGVYFFLASAAADSNKFAKASLMINDTEISYVLCENNTSSSCHCIVHLDAGDSAYMETFNEVCRFHAAGDTSFAGLLLQPLDTE